MDTKIKIHWHERNPWADKVVYVPAEELAEAISGGTAELQDGTIIPLDKEFFLSRWRKHEKIDCYILPHPNDKYHSVGVRYGPKGHQYYSPYGRNWDELDKLLIKYQRRYPN